MLEESLPEGLTFDDVLLLPARSDVLPRDTDVSTCLTNHIPLNIPLLSAAMDTVTESNLAIALAQEGGVGIMHKNLDIQAQAAEVDNVDPNRGIRYSLESMAIQAALDGHGVALVSNVLVEADIEAGRLVRLFDLGLHVGHDVAYYLAYTSSRVRHPRVAVFRDWILDEVSQSERLVPPV